MLLPFSNAQYVDEDGVPLALAQMFFYLEGTTTPSPVYEGNDLAVSFGVSVTADASGMFPVIYFDPDIPLRMKFIVAGGDVMNPLFDVDPVSATLEITAGQIADGAIEEKLGFTPVDPDADTTFTELLRITKTLTEADGTEVGYRGLPIRTANAATIFGLDDIGKMLRKDDTGAYLWTIPLNAAVPHPVGARIYFHNGNATNVTIDKTVGVTLVAYRDSSFTNAVTVTVGPGEWGLIHKVGTNSWMIEKFGFFPALTIATLPGTGVAGQQIYVSDLGGGPGLLQWDATDSKWVRSRTEGVSTVANDAAAAFTWTPLASAPSINLAVPITANRAVTLGTGNAYKGQSAYFTRGAASTGAFNWSIGGLKNLAVSTWCRVTYDGAAWYLAAYGAL